MNRIVIFGGSGYIGTHLAKRWLENNPSGEVVVADIEPSALENHKGVVYKRVDVRQPIPKDLSSGTIDWIFNFAAIHREPGHRPEEYFDTNLKGAENVTEYAEAIGCPNIFFTSSISVYGPTSGPTPETSQICPVSPYGGSKYPAELIHQRWQTGGAGRRLMIVRPGVVYGPEDPGNIGRMIKAIRKGYFAFPGSTNIRKSYAYIYGLLDSMDFVIKSDQPCVTYNYVETPTETLGEIARQVKKFVGSSAPILSIPTSVLLPAATIVQMIAGSRNPVHPVRVRKAGMSTHIVPQQLLNMGFPFRYTFEKSLEHWRTVNPNDFIR